MSTTGSSDVWEFSKENIQPLLQGRKPEVLKHALCEHPEDQIQQQRQAFENELRTYSGEDPLSVWCRYINWVEQNFPKGGVDGHLEQLVRKCISILKDESKYYNDKRFITIWLKFASASVKPIEVYNYMYSHNIGCKSANFFIAWSWELEQQNNIKKANHVLKEGINRNADPVENIKSYFSEFAIRIMRKMGETEQNVDLDYQRSAFTILKTQRNSVPIERTGESVMEPTNANMIINRQQPAPRNNENAPSQRVPFKIHNAKTHTPSLPVQSVGAVPFVFHSDSVKENEIKPSRWNKVKVKQAVPIHRPTSSTEVGFSFHCDEAPQPICTPRSVPKVSDVLRSRQKSRSHAMALFEPLDPMKRPMYDKNKVYGGAEEFSLEEIKAAAWLKQHKELNADKLINELKPQIVPPNTNSTKTDIGFKIHSDEDNPLATQKSVPCSKINKNSDTLPSWQGNENPLRALFSPVNPMKRPVYDRNEIYRGKEELSLEELRANIWLDSQRKLQEKQKELKPIQNQVNNLKKELDFFEACEPESAEKGGNEHLAEQQTNSPHTNQAYDNEYQNQNAAYNSEVEERKCDPSDIQLLNSQPYSDIKATHENECQGKEYSNIELPNPSSSNPFQLKESKNTNLENQEQKEDAGKMFSSIPTDMGGTASVTDILQGKHLKSTSYCEAADIIRQLYNGTIAGLPNAAFESEYLPNKSNNDSLKDMIYNDVQETFHKESFGGINKEGLPFTLYQDPSENASVKKNDFQDTVSSQVKSNFPFSLYQDPTETALPPNENLDSGKFEHASAAENQEVLQTNEDIENIPPKGFIQDKAKRELNGILTLSKDIMYVPLELQEVQDDCSDPDDIFIEGNRELFPNETLVPPCNTEQFASAPFFSSTPCTSSKNGKRPNLHISNTADTYNYRSEYCNAGTENCNMGPPQETAENMTNKQLPRLEKNTYPGRPSILSVIMETSKESYKSSASSGSSASVTKLSQTDQCYSYDKSNITHKESIRADTFKEPARADTFKEPKPIGLESNFSDVKKVVNELLPQHHNKKQKIFDLGNFVKDPFDKKLTETLLQSLNQPPDHYANLEICEKFFKCLKVNDKVEVNGVTYLIENLIAEGAYGKVFIAEKQLSSQNDYDSSACGSRFAFKVCRKDNEWELYICSTLHKRLREMQKTLDTKSSVMEVMAAQKCKSGMILITEYCQQGTLLDLVNFYKKQNSSVPEYITMYITLELLQTMLKIHECKIIHADIKPDNILLRDFSVDMDVLEYLDQKTFLLKFIDFGRSIDLNFFKEGTCFTAPLKNRCIEILENKPWVFQPDWCGILDCVHTLLFTEYMKVKQNGNGRWELEKKLKRYWATDIWSPLFDELLNIQACYKEPNISEHVTRIKAKLLQNAKCFKTQFVNLRNSIAK